MIRMFVILALVLNTVAMQGQIGRERRDFAGNGDMLAQEIAVLEKDLTNLAPDLGRMFWKGEDERTICRVYLYEDDNGKVFEFQVEE